MGYEAFAEFHRVARGQMRPLGAIEAGKLREIGIINAGRVGHFQDRVPALRSWHEAVFKFFQTAGVRKTNKNNLPAATANFFNRGSDVSKTLLDPFFHSGEEDILRDISWRRRRCEERQPDLLDFFRQRASWFGAFFPHTRATFLVFALKIRR